MKVRAINYLAAILLPIVIAGCIEKPVGPVTGKTVTLTGKVLSEGTQLPVAGAVVSLKVPPLSATTDSTGTYRFSFEADSAYSTSLTILRSGFSPDSVTVSITPGQSVSKNFTLKVVVTTGLPDQAHFTMSIEKKNFPGLTKLDATNSLQVRVGDKLGNPVLPETQISFSTHGGTIDGSALTNSSGFAQATLYGGNPQPVDAVYGRGFTWVKASTIGETGTVQDSLLVLFSGATQITAPASGFTLRDGGTQQFEYTVADENGNPLTAGTVVGVSVSGAATLKLQGDVNFVLPDTQDKTQYTKFSFTLTDTKSLDSDGNKPLSVTISVASDNGDKSYTFTGMLLAPDVSGGGGSGGAATIAFIQASLNAISVREVGGDETAVLTFEVRDSLGIPIDAAHQATVSFVLEGGPGGGEYVSPTSAMTDPSTARVQTTINAGFKAGAVQIIAQTTVGARVIRSAPVIVNIFGGFPDDAHFSIGVEKLNFPGYNILNLTNRITVLAGDKYSNPVRPGTAVYFNTTGGIINIPSTAYTSDEGVATATLRSGNPRPVDPVYGPGFARVTASTIGEHSEAITDTAIVLFSGVSQIYNVSPTSFAVAAGGTSGPIHFTVSDQNGNPLSGGTVISVTLQYTAPPNTTINLSVTGDVSVTLGDTQASGPGTTEFSFQVVDQTVGGVGTRIPVTVVISVTSPNGTPPNVSVSGTVG